MKTIHVKNETGISDNTLITGKEGDKLDGCISKMQITILPRELIKAEVELCPMSLDLIIEKDKTDIVNIHQLNDMFRSYGYTLVKIYR